MVERLHLRGYEPGTPFAAARVGLRAYSTCGVGRVKDGGRPAREGLGTQVVAVLPPTGAQHVKVESRLAARTVVVGPAASLGADPGREIHCGLSGLFPHQ